MAVTEQAFCFCYACRGDFLHYRCAEYLAKSLVDESVRFADVFVDIGCRKTFGDAAFD